MALFCDVLDTELGPEKVIEREAGIKIMRKGRQLKGKSVRRGVEREQLLQTVRKRERLAVWR